MSTKNKITAIAFIILVGALSFTTHSLRKTKAKLEISQQNETSLLTGFETYRTKNGEMVGTVMSLRLELDKFKRYYEEDAKKIKELGIKLKNVESVAKTELEAKVKIIASLKDTVISTRDTLTNIIVREAIFKKVHIDEPYLKFDALISDTTFTGNITVPVKISQYIEAVYKRRFLWWRWGLKGFKQSVVVDNPYVDIKYAEMLYVGKSKRKK